MATIIYVAKKPKYTTTTKGQKLLANHWQYKVITFWGFILFNKTCTNRFFTYNGKILHFFGFRFDFSYLNQQQIKDHEKFCKFSRMSKKKRRIKTI